MEILIRSAIQEHRLSAGAATVLQELQSTYAAQNFRPAKAGSHRVHVAGITISIRSLAVSTGMPRQTVWYYIRLLVRTGFIKRVGKTVVHGALYGCRTMTYVLTRKALSCFSKKWDNPSGKHCEGLVLEPVAEVFAARRVGQLGRWLFSLVRRHSWSTRHLADAMGWSVRKSEQALSELQRSGLLVYRDGVWSLHDGHEGDAFRHAAQVLRVAGILTERRDCYAAEQAAWCVAWSRFFQPE